MTHIHIHDVREPAELVSALAAVTEAFLDPAAYEDDRLVFAKSDPGPDWPSPRTPDPVERPEPEWFLPCPDRGTHTRLTDCWMCWADVHRGAAVETEVLRVSWDTGLARLVDGEDGR